MLAPWSNLPSDFSLEEYLERYEQAIEKRPSTFAGRWAQACHVLERTNEMSAYREVRLDLGCGKGAFTVGSALQEPDVLFIGIDIDPICVACAAGHAIQSHAHNVVFVPGRDGTLLRVFEPGELARIYLNFPTPHPKGREAALRLTYAKRLETYRSLLKTGGLLEMQTDNQPFFSYTLAQLQIAGYSVLTSSMDARAELPPTPQTGYEQRAVAAGAKIFALRATPSNAAPSIMLDEETLKSAAPTSLYDYLPSGPDDTRYIPPEMERGIRAIRRTRR